MNNIATNINRTDKIAINNNDIAISVKNVSCFYGKNEAVKNVSLDIPANSIYSFIGPSGCGKTTG